MSDDYEPRADDHLIEPMIDAVRGDAPVGESKQGPSRGEPSRLAGWAPLLVPLAGFAIALTVWGLWRLFE